jgi:hypothetical protein
MLLSTAASFFDRTLCNDGYTGDELFLAQMALYDDTKRDSEVAERRVISTAPDVTLPARGVVEMLGSRYILGKANPDVFDGEVVRLGHVAHEASTLAQIKTLDQACLDLPGIEAWSSHAWVKNKAFTEQDSVLTPEFHIFFSRTESLQRNLVIEYQDIHYIVRSKNIGAAGLLVTTAEEIDSPSFEEGTVKSGYDPVLGTFSTTSTPIKLMRLRWQALFRYNNSITKGFGPDEEQFVISKSQFTAVPGAEIVLASGTFRINSVDDIENTWVCRVARHA